MENLLKIGLACAYPSVTHYAVLHHRPGIAITALLLVLLLMAWPWLRRTWHKGMALLSVGVLAILLQRAPDLTWLLYGPPVIINLLLCYLFGQTLAGGREPMISWFARLERGALTAELARYTRRLTWVWTVFFFTMALTSALLARFASLHAWSLFTNLVNYLLAAALFLGEYAYRRIAYRHYTHATPWQLYRRIRAAGWTPSQSDAS